jgi:hypothetical protein
MIGAFRRANAAIFRGAAVPCRPQLTAATSPPKIAITVEEQTSSSSLPEGSASRSPV